MSEQNKKPLWVSIGWILLGLTNVATKKGAMILFGFFLLCSFVCIPVSIYMEDWSWAGMMFPISFWLWLCIRWGEKNNEWEAST
jgi:hypothetical protein